MNLKQLEVFLAVADSGSFSRGAEATFITQSTVSQHIAALENELGVKLLDRTSRGALLTEGGKLFLEHARRVVSDTREIERTMRRFRGVEEAALRVGGSTIPGDYLIPESLPHFFDRYPGISLTLLQGDSRETVNRLIREEIEIGVVGSRFEEEGITFTPFGRDEIRLVARPDHPLAGGGAVAPAELGGLEFIVREAGSGTGRAVAEALRAAGILPESLRVRACLGSTEAVKRAVAGGLGVAFLSEISIRRELARGELAVIAVRKLNISRPFCLAERAGRELSPAARAFAELMQERYR
ncbi:selenium metabolism-associated LysR family transcriptional regulator [Geobacter sp.]|uniref:selenium metabolism-associated LysR family transcriptional regulator n=1 Tax=Geobacter sp. TaxID=46610 RepID=UPI0026061EA8|nr:selenium metabolism-associated LysR family transcriptional regulator [Geobacter sp.]